MTKIEVFSDRFVTAKNPNGRQIIDIDTPEGVDVFGGQDTVDEYKHNILVHKEMKKMAEERLASN